MGFFDFFKPSRVISGPQWRFYGYPRDDGSRGFVGFDADVAEQRGDPAYASCRRVVAVFEGAVEGIYLPDGFSTSSTERSIC